MSAKEKQRSRNKKDHFAKSVNFTLGDFVLWSRVDVPSKKSKLGVFWIGPYRVTNLISDNVFEIECLRTYKKKIAHASRLKYYHDSSLNVSEELIQFISQQDVTFEIENIIDHKYDNDIKSYIFLIEWKGFEAIENSWEPFSNLIKDVKVLLSRYIKSTGKKELLELLEGSEVPGLRAQA